MAAELWRACGKKMDKSWMIIKNRIKSKEYRAGVKSFIEFAMSNVGLGVDIWCPCVDCMNAKKQSTEVVKIHLVLRGISISYKTWVQHGESVPVHRLCVSNEDACFHSKSSRDSVEGNNLKDREELPNMVEEAQMLRVREESSQSVVQLTPEEMSWEEEEAHTGVRGWPKSSSSSPASDAASPRLDEEFLKLKADMEKMQVEREVERRAREEEKREREMERRAHEVGQKKMADLMSLVTQLIQEKKQTHSSSIHCGGHISLARG